MDASAFTRIRSGELLAGVNVVELSHHVAGAYCGKVLAQLGASVSRCGPETEVVGSPRTRAAMQRVFHARKRMLPARGPELDAALSQAHIVIAERGAHVSALAALIEDVISRRTGLPESASVIVLSAVADKDRDLPGSGLTASAWAGMSWAIGEPSREPLAPPYDIVEHEAGISAAAAAMTALLADFGIAKGTVDVSMRDVLAQFVGILVQNYLPYGRPWQRDGRRPFMSGGIYPLGLFTCRDGHVALYCRSEPQWRSIIRAMGDPERLLDESFRDPRIVARHLSEEADTYLLPWLEQHTRAEIAQMGLEFGFPSAPVRFMGEVLSDPQFEFRGSFERLEAEADAPLMVPAEAWRLYEMGSVSAAPARAWPLQRKEGVPPSSFFNGLRVLDLSWVWSGPMVTSILADFGADVIKIEHPSHPDSVRTRGRPLREGNELEGPIAELNPWFNQLNHGKRSAVLDLKSDRTKILALAASCDVVVENMRPGALDKVGLGYSDLARMNPALVMLSMSLPGQWGPLRHMKGYAGIMTSMAGLESLVGYREAGGEQTVVGMAKTALGDPNAAVHGVTVLLAALHRRKRTGRGAWIDLAQTDAILGILAGPLLESQLYGGAPVVGNEHPLHAPHGHFPCVGKNQWVAIAVQTDAQWRAVVRVAHAAELEPYACFDAAARLARRRDIEQALGAWTSQKARDAMVAMLIEAGVPAAPVASFEDTNIAWKQARGLARRVDHPYIGPQDVLVPPWHFGGLTAGASRPAPLLGADTEEVLRELAELTTSG